MVRPFDNDPRGIGSIPLRAVRRKMQDGLRKNAKMFLDCGRKPFDSLRMGEN